MPMGFLGIPGLGLATRTLSTGGALLPQVLNLFDDGNYSGVIYKASRYDEGFLYQEYIGQTLVSAATQSIGRATDFSRFGTKSATAFIAAQPELVSYGALELISGSTGTLSDQGGGVWRYTAGAADSAAPNSRPGVQISGLDTTQDYVTRVAVTAGSQTAQMQGLVSEGVLADQEEQLISLPLGTGEIRFRFNGASPAEGQYIEFSLVSIKALPGYNAIQSTSNSRPTLQQPSRFVFRGDGFDDFLATLLVPGSANTLYERGTPDSGSGGDVLIGSQPASDGKLYMGMDTSGRLAGGVGTQNTATIYDQSGTDIRGVLCSKALRQDGATVTLNLDDMATPVYSGAQSGAVNTTIPINVLALNNNGSYAAAADSDTEFLFAIQKHLTNAELALVDAYAKQ